MAATLAAEQIQCSICLDIFSKPVSIPCGHNFCLDCIATCWATAQQAACPLCKEVFHPAPALRINRNMADIAEVFTRSLTVEEDVDAAVTTETKDLPLPGQQVHCDICQGPKSMAARSCQVCQTSYCQAHLRPHETDAVLRRHRLAEPAAFPARGRCRRHQGPLDMFCYAEKMPVCATCIQTDHRGHNAVLVEAETERVKVKMKKTEEHLLQLVETRSGKVQEVTCSLRQGETVAEKEVQASMEVFEELGDVLSRVQAGLLEEQGKARASAEMKAKAMLEELAEETAQLRERCSMLEQLRQTQEHLHLLQSFPSLCEPPTLRNWSEVSIHDNLYVSAARAAVSKMAVFCGEVETRLCAQELQLIRQYAVDVVLDPATACPWLALSPDGKQVSYSSKPNPSWSPSDPRRFELCVCVLGTQPIRRGRHSWVVEVGDKSEWDVGVARESIDRKGSIRVRPEHGYWAVCRRKGGPVTVCATPVTTPFTELLPRRVCVYVDYEGGAVRFYDADARRHLHTFAGCHFNEPLYPYFNPCIHDDGPLVICPAEGRV